MAVFKTAAFVRSATLPERLSHHAWVKLSRLMEWPGVEPPDVELGDVDQLSRSYPEAAETLRSFR